MSRNDDWVETVPSKPPPPLLDAEPSMFTVEGRIAANGRAMRNLKHAGRHDSRRWVRWTSRVLLYGFLLGPFALLLGAALVDIFS